ncbi:hypothetical protein HanIR_Chr06g0259031 [Helianthus annuus]|nr:hypothetical protein HanIR_Chr06g0259031 [Helianthus annuus]
MRRWESTRDKLCVIKTTGPLRQALYVVDILMQFQQFQKNCMLVANALDLFIKNMET